MHLHSSQHKRLSAAYSTSTHRRCLSVSARRPAADAEDPLVAPLQQPLSVVQQQRPSQGDLSASPSVATDWAPYTPAPGRRDLPAALPQPTPRQLRAQQAEAARQEKAARKAEQKRQWRLARKQKRDAEAARRARAGPPPHLAAAPAGSPAPHLGLEPGYITTPGRLEQVAGDAGQQHAELPQWDRPPPAPQDPQQLLEVLQSLPTPRVRLVIFKGGGYILSDLDALLITHRLDHVMRVTNLIRKAHCVLAKPAWDNGKRVQLQEHRAAARKRRVPFLLVQRLQVEELLVVVRPLLLAKGIVRRLPGEERLSVPQLAEQQWGPQPVKPPRQRPTRQAQQLRQQLAQQVGFD